MSRVNSFHSRHFNLDQLAEGVYAAINTEEGWAICNAGIIDLGDRTLVYDSFLSSEAARHLRDAAEELTGRPVHAVINSHPHNDHIWGNQVFSADVDIISTTRTRELIATEGLAEVQEYRQITPARLEVVQAQFAEAHDETTRKQLKYYITYFQAIIATLPELHIRLPNLTFTGELGFSGTNRSARIFTIEGDIQEVMQSYSFQKMELRSCPICFSSVYILIYLMVIRRRSVELWGK